MIKKNNFRFAIFGKIIHVDYFIKLLNKHNFPKPIIFISPDKTYQRDKGLLRKYNLYSEVELLEKKKLVKIYRFKNVNNSKVLKILTKNKCNIGFVASCRNIIKKDIINYFNDKLYNIHDSFLPEERGGGIYSWRILNNYNFIGNSIHLIDEGIDTGDIILKKKIKINKTKPYPLDHMKKEVKNVEILIDKFIDILINNRPIKKEKQQNDKSFYFHRLYTEQNGLINWDWSIENIERFIRAFSYPYPGAYTFYKNKKISILESSVEKNNKKFHPFLNGKIVTVMDNKFVRIIAGGKTLILKKIKVGKLIISPGYFLKVKNSLLSEADKLFIARSYIPDISKMKSEF